MSKKNQVKNKPEVKAPVSSKIDMVFTRQNYILTAIAFAVVIIGFLLMYADKDEVYGFRSMTLAPIVVLLGFIIGVYAIMYKPKSDSDNGAD